VKQGKKLSTIKKQQYRGLRTQIAKELNFNVATIDNVLRGRTKDPILLAKVRRVATSLIEKHLKELKSI